MSELKRTQLYTCHLEAGASMVDFGGWEMPIQYPSKIVAEHLCTRTACSLFDVSHMGRVVIKGKDTVPGEVSDNILVIFNCKPQEMELDLYAHDVVKADWKVCIDGDKAGTKTLRTITDGKVKLAPISAMVLVRGENA